jgi:branched-chain amino acid transport system permease protein
MSDVLQQAIVSGFLIGGLYAVMSVGISLTWGALKIINLAHFSFILLGAYITYELTTTFEVDPLLALMLVIPGGFVAGVILQIFFELTKVDEFQSLIISFGIFIIFQSVTRTIWTADFRRIEGDLNRYDTLSFFVGDIAVQVAPLLAFGTAVAIAIGMSLLLSRTYFGKAVRAIVEDPEIARAYGIDDRRVAVMLSGVSTAFSAVAGLFIATFQSLSPSMSFAWFGIVFPVVILGGLGNAVGALGAGVIVGVAAGVAAAEWGPLSAPLVTFIILIAALLFRPQGLFTRKSSS